MNLMKIAIWSTLMTAFATIGIGTASADNGVCVDALADSIAHTTVCAEYGRDNSKQAFCPYVWTGAGFPDHGIFVCGGDPNCPIYYDNFDGVSGCLFGEPFYTLGETLWTVGSTVDNVLP